MRQPKPADPDWPRYCDREFPPYRFVPGHGPHPYRDPEGHSYRQPMPTAEAVAPDDWRQSEDYLLGIDYFNFAYWWESHEILEEIWHAVGHDCTQGQFLQGLIQIAAAFLHRFRGNDHNAELQKEAGLARLENVPDTFMGVDVRDFSQRVRKRFDESATTYPLIRLG